MSPDLQTNLEIPDLWYDIYARFLPGTIFTFAIRYLFLDITTIPTGVEIILYIGAGYITALITQPIASLITDQIDKSILRNKKKEILFFRQAEKALGDGNHHSKIVSKMHGEVTFFIQVALLSILYFLIELIYLSNTSYSLIIPWVISFLSFGLSIIVAYRRFKRAENDLVIYAKS
ncbi:MAG: hypothetical protein A2X25_06720 [Chloroflexi bacterium GWB2_49_20]|nr:MAG: hypothetical protein A2X25_06720 [Chloroflexi bacterium GWB2_49_20]OGN80269.1 MAG: hypothetical protein A2X26_08060 [Chloroflexi bacterium GWC2_49_37]OGN86091.1 MAG: hypothetical protein A2X27_00685 [Chloroflexi bacterium GWD2_49_16]HCC79396.1 hypothetical protein [Anaerolineae bacterium]HCM96383.1 hypothetical protein [Anaerolineae bacterium]